MVSVRIDGQETPFHAKRDEEREAQISESTKKSTLGIKFSDLAS